jgi:hypothetical protein
MKNINIKFSRNVFIKTWLQLIKVKFAFHIMLHIIVKNNCQRKNNEIPITQTNLHFWDKLLNVFLIPNKEKCEWELEFTMNVLCNEELNLFRKMKIKECIFVICNIAFNHFQSIVNNISSLLVAMDAWRKSNFWTFDFIQQALQWTLLIGKMMTFATW